MVKMYSYSYRTKRSINEIPKGDWQRLFGDMPEGYGFYQTLEQSNLREFQFLYALIYQDQNLVAIAPLFTGDFDLGIGIGGPAGAILKAVRRVRRRFLINETLFCGSPFGEHAAIGMAPEVDIETLAHTLGNGLVATAHSQGAVLIMFKDFLTKDAPLLNALCRRGFFKAASFPCVTVPLPFTSMEEYLASLSHATRKDLRRKIKKSREAGDMEVKVVENADGIIDDIYALYLNTYNASTVHFEKLTKEFFLNAGRYMPETKYFLYYFDGKLGSFNLCFAHKDTLIDKFIGFDYAVKDKYPLYFLTWVTNVGWCIANGIKHYQVGQTDYGPKLRLGGQCLDLHVAIKHRNPLLHLFFKMSAQWFEPQQPRH